MKKKSIISLIKYHAEKNDVGFRDEAYEIAREFDRVGDSQLSGYIMTLLSNANTFVPQMTEPEFEYLERVESTNELLLLSDTITEEIHGMINAIQRQLGSNKFLFEGAPGTGKTEAVKHLGRILNRVVYMVDFSLIIDSKLGQTQKNITKLFKEINQISQPDKFIILFDEIDALAMDRTDSNDLREMARSTTTLFKGLDALNEDIVLIATTNLYAHFDKALIRRFDSVINFNHYTEEDLLKISESMLDHYLSKTKLVKRDIRLFRKIIKLFSHIPYPGDLKNIIKTAISFSSLTDDTDYFRKLYCKVCDEKPKDIHKLQDQGFTVREIEILTGMSKSSVARSLKEVGCSE